MVRVRDLLALMDEKERVEVYSCSTFWSSLGLSCNLAGEVLVQVPSEILDSLIVNVYRSIHNRIVIEF